MADLLLRNLSLGCRVSPREQTQAPYTPLETDELGRSNQGMVS